jgi:hypothetical protein
MTASQVRAMAPCAEVHRRTQGAYAEPRCPAILPPVERVPWIASYVKRGAGALALYAVHGGQRIEGGACRVLKPATI